MSKSNYVRKNKDYVEQRTLPREQYEARKAARGQTQQAQERKGHEDNLRTLKALGKMTGTGSTLTRIAEPEYKQTKTPVKLPDKTPKSTSSQWAREGKFLNTVHDVFTKPQSSQAPKKSTASRAQGAAFSRNLKGKATSAFGGATNTANSTRKVLEREFGKNEFGKKKKR